MDDVIYRHWRRKSDAYLDAGRFRAATYLGRPVPAYFTIPVQFKRKPAWR